jgi:hypothetical protein
MFTYPTLLISCIRIYCILYPLLHLAYAVQPLPIHIFICTYSYSSLHICVYKVVVVNLLDYLLDITALSDLEAQVFSYTRIICEPCVCDK